jgi:hypothetical protein
MRAAAAAALRTREAELTSPKQLTAEAVGGLMLLVLAGRCCLHWAAALGQLQGRSDLGQLLMQLQQHQGESASAWSVVAGLNERHAIIAMGPAPKSLAESVLSTCLAWLQLQDNAGQLAAAGYPAEAVMMQQLSQCSMCCQSRSMHLMQQQQSLPWACWCSGFRRLGSLSTPWLCRMPATTLLALRL